MKSHKIFLYIIFGSIGFFTACKKLTDISSPKNELTTDKVFTDTTSAKSAVFNIYVDIERTQYPLFNKYLSTYADEVISPSLADYNQSRLSAGDTFNQNDWSALYLIIYECNAVLEQLGQSTILPQVFRTQLSGEAKFMRAYAYFILANLYGKVPIINGTDVNVNRQAMQSDSAAIYQQVISDLTDAKGNLSQAYAGTGRIRANKACATALLAKVYFYQRNWALAESMATEVISSGLYTPLDATANAFKSTSRESILQLASQTGFINEAPGIVPSSATTVPAYYFTDNFYQSFESNDLRKLNWIGTNTVTSGTTTTVYRYPFKYKNRVANTSSPENLLLLRVSEQYLIRAEARAYQGRLTGASSATEDINIIRSRAGLGTVNPQTLPEALQLIYSERRHELFFENADRFLDLKRTGNIQKVMLAAKPTWISTAAFLPIPLNEITYNPNLKQNAGY